MCVCVCVCVCVHVGIKSQPTSWRATSTQVANSSNAGRVYRPSQPPLPHTLLPLPLPPNGDTVYSQIKDKCKPTPTGSEQETIDENPPYGCGLTDDNYSLLQAPTSLSPTSNAVHSTQLSDVYDCKPLGDPEYELLDDVRKQSNEDTIGDKENKEEEKKEEKEEHDTCTRQDTSGVPTQPENDEQQMMELHK